ncbi:hypothetical protein MRX96_035874 [Rhipicephalus microplus]
MRADSGSTASCSGGCCGLAAPFLIIFIVMAYVIVSNRSKPPPARNATPAAVSPAQLSALQRQSSAGTTTHRPSQLCTSRNRADLQPQRT